MALPSLHHMIIPRLDASFGVTLASACASLCSGAVLLLSLTAVLNVPGMAPAAGDTDHDTAPAVLRGHHMRVIVGEAAPVGASMSVTGLGQGGRAVLSRPLRLSASQYPLLRFDLSGQHPGMHLYFFWRRADQPDTLHRRALAGDGDDGVMWANLAASKQWRGTIVEVGIDLYGDLRGGHLLVKELALNPLSFATRLATIWSQWRAFDVWGQRSINYYPGAPEDAIVPPNVAMILWSVSALVSLPLFAVLLSSSFLARRHYFDVHAAIAVVLVPWLVHDGLWQEHLDDQLRETRYLFAGKTHHEKQLVALDAPLYRYALVLRDIIPASRDTRLFIVHDSEGHQYERLRMQYHLLPRNIYNFGRTLPPGEALQPGDYILALNDPPSLSFDAPGGSLDWPPAQSIPASRVHRHPLGTLYRVEAARNPGDSGGGAD